jgi:hypothetical protein
MKHPAIIAVCGLAAIGLGVATAWGVRTQEPGGCEACGIGAVAAASARQGTPGETIAAADFFGKLFDTSDFPRRWNCGTWTAGHGWLHIGSDLAIWAAYMSIPLALFYFVHNRQDIPFTKIFWLFMAFIAVCGTGHLIEAGIFWWPAYRLAGIVKLLTAVVSWVTVLSLLPVIPKALAMPGLQKINEQLKREVTERTEAERLAKARGRELEETYQTFVGREQRIVELKRQVNEFARLAGRPEPHDLGFTSTSNPSAVA